MALLEPFMAKVASGNVDFELKALPGKSILVTDIFVFNPATNYVTISIDQTVVGYWRVGGNLGNHLPLPIGNLEHSHAIAHNNTAVSSPATSQIVNALGVAITTLGMQEADAAATEHANVVKFGAIPQLAHKTILQLLREKGYLKGYPVAGGQSLRITGAKQVGALVMAFYQVYDAGDIKHTDPNGSAATEFVFCNYGRVAADVIITGDTNYSVSQTPPEFDSFPFGERAPANKEIDILAVLASDVVDNRGSNDSMATEYLKFIFERTTWFDEDKKGLLLKGIIGPTDAAAQIARGLSIVGNFSDVDAKPPFWFEPPRMFKVNEEFGIYLGTTAGSAQNNSDLLVADLEIGLLERIRRIA